MMGYSLVVAIAFFLAAANSGLPVTGSTICLNDSTIPGGGCGGEGDGEYAPVLLVGRYKMKVESTNEQFQKLEDLAREQLKLQREHLTAYHDRQNLPQNSAEGLYCDCEEAYERGVRVSGVYTIKPDNDFPFQVYCDMETDSGGWTVFQRRMDGSVDFFRDWMDYARGFGNLTGEFWLGLRRIHRISALSSGAAGNELRVDLEDFEGNTAYAKYGNFAIGDSATKYVLSISGYSGTAGDAFSYHNGRQFSTKDQDNDINNDSCAQIYKGAWWYGSCHHANLNGLYLAGHHNTPGEGVQWFEWTGNKYSLKFAEMKVRRQ